MRTTTILSAYLEAEGRRNSIFAKRTRQRDKFGTALLSRIEAGDRAREALQQLAEAVGHDLLMRATFGEVTDTERAIAEILGKYFEEPQP